MLTVIGFYTDDPLYTKHALALKATAEIYNIDIVLEKVSKDDWQKIIAFKPTFIAKMRRTLAGPLLYVDVDAIFKVDIKSDFKDISEDIAVHYFKNDYGLCSGTIYFNDTPAVNNLVELWVNKMAAHRLWDQKVLEDLVNELVFSKLLKVRKLSAEYTFIYDLSAEEFPELKAKIEHLQASRDFSWIKKYRIRNQMSRFIMTKPMFSKITRVVMDRHSVFNDRMKALDLDIRLSLDDLMNR